MIRNWWNRLLNRKGKASKNRRRPLLSLEQLEDRSLMSVTGFSPISEIGNNVANPFQGVSFNTSSTQGTTLADVAGGDLLRIDATAHYINGINTASLTYGNPTNVAGPRLVSNDVSNQAVPLFSGSQGSTDFNTVNQNGLSDFGYTFGQFIDHDMDLTPTQSSGDPAIKDGPNGFPIPVDTTHDGLPTTGIPGPELVDPIGTPGADNLNLHFTRSLFDPNTGTSTSNQRQQINVSTSFLDLSQVYGSTQVVSDALRTHNGDGKLKSSPGANGITGDADDLLPFDTTDYFTATEIAALGMGNDVGLPGTVLFAAGDPRANETTELTSLQTLFMRNHNAIAAQLATMNPATFGFASWNDQNLFDEARKLNIAQYQNIVYNGYLAALLGPTALNAYTGYQGGVDARISTEFSTLAFRFGHSLLNNNVELVANDGSSLGSIPLAESFFNPALLTPNATDFFGNSATTIGAVLKGDADNAAQANDVYGVSAIRNLLFGSGGQGEDLIARDMWRVDDHGIGDYNQVRASFFSFAAAHGIDLSPLTDTGGGPFTSFVSGQPFHGFENISSDPTVVANLALAFTGPTREAFLTNLHSAGNIHPFIAGLAEDHVPGSDLGPLFHTILVDQFERLRDGDRFFYLNQSFNAGEQAILNSGSTLGQVITARTGITNLQADVFRFLSQEDGNTKGFFTNKNGQEKLTGSQTGTQLTSGLYNTLFAPTTGLLANGATNSVLVDASGSAISLAFFASYAHVKSFLQSQGTMANKLSIQLLTAEFNVFFGDVDPTTSIFVPAVTVSGQPISSILQGSLQTNGVSNPSGIANIQAILNSAISQLRNGSTDSTFEEALKVCLDAINSNQAIFILN